jgi:nucleoside-diphosphate-sugar epimerase
MDIARAAEDGYGPAYSIEEALGEYGDWLREGNPW